MPRVVWSHSKKVHFVSPRQVSEQFVHGQLITASGRPWESRVRDQDSHMRVSRPGCENAPRALATAANIVRCEATIVPHEGAQRA